MEELANYILKFGDLNQQQLDLILSKVQPLKLKKNEFLCQAGKIPKYLGFVTQGVFRYHYYNNHGQDITRYFIDEHNFVSDYPKFMDQSVSTEYIQAVTDCSILAFTKSDWDEIGTIIVGWELISGKIEKHCLTESLERRSPLVSEDATARYLSFLKNFPLILNRVPLSFVASYLGITQQSLSRIRKNIQ